MSANFEAKKQVVEEIKERIQNAKSVVFVSFNGLSVAEDTELRREFRKNNVDYKVLKNTLIRRAFNDLGVTSFDADLNGTTSFAFAQDETSAAKVISENAKKLEDKISAKSGYVNGEYVDAKGVAVLAAIPSKEVLVATLAGTLKGMISGLAVALNKVAEKMGE